MARAAGLSARQSIDLGVFRKPAELLLGEDQPSVDGDLEDAGNPFDEFDLFCAAFHEPGLRTEGPRFIVSGHAVFDPDLHCSYLMQQLMTRGYHGRTVSAIVLSRHRPTQCSKLTSDTASRISSSTFIFAVDVASPR